MDDLAVISCEHPLKGFAGDYDFQVPLLAADHVTDDAGTGFVHTAPGHGREDFDVWTSNAAKLAARGHQYDDPLYRRRRRPLHRSRSGLHRQACAHRHGRKGRCQRGRDQGADRRRHAARARPAQAPVSAFLALEKAGDLPQHAAMVHCDGQADRRRRGPCAGRRYAARPRARRHRGHPLGAGAREEPHHRHGREQAGLGDLAATRLGRADHGLRPRERRRLGRDPQRRARQQAHRRRLRAGRRRRLVCNRRRRAFSQARLRFQRVAEGR